MEVLVMDEHAYNENELAYTHFHHATAATAVEAAKHLHPDVQKDRVEIRHVHSLDVKAALECLQDFDASALVLGNLKVDIKTKDVMMNNTRMSYDAFLAFLSAARQVSKSLRLLIVLGEKHVMISQDLSTKMDTVVVFQKPIEYSLQLKFTERLFVSLFRGDSLGTSFARACAAAFPENVRNCNPVMFSYPQLDYKSLSLIEEDRYRAMFNLPQREPM
eukprot:TRINITY_DN3221_c0_g2_i1.p1 TRINITY_DN3221_c0_g2~~TRINITY_DN3221_c0_g2_i1.p1  ORF type:complete len:218 (-),score=37.96 TRINITY_DN3221_c0_g2_i1:744-1397(-)